MLGRARTAISGSSAAGAPSTLSLALVLPHSRKGAAVGRRSKPGRQRVEEVWNRQHCHGRQLCPPKTAYRTWNGQITYTGATTAYGADRTSGRRDATRGTSIRLST